MVFQASKLLICATSLLAQGSNTFKSHTPAQPPLAPFQSHLLHLHSMSPNVACFSLTNKPCGKQFCGPPVPYTIWHWDEVHWISQGFVYVTKGERGAIKQNPVISLLLQQDLSSSFVAQTQLCRTVLFNSLFRTICPTGCNRLRCIWTIPSAQTGSLAFIMNFRNLSFANSALWRGTESTKELLLSSVVSLLQMEWSRNSSSALWTLLVD